MCVDGDGGPGSYGEALAMVSSGLDYLGTADLPDAVLGEVLLGLQAAGARHAAARGAVLSRFDAADAHDPEGYQNSSSWLRDRSGMTRPAARRQVRQSRILRSRPRLAGAMGQGMLSESWLEKIIAWTRPVPDDMLDFTDQMIVEVLEAGGDLDDFAKVIATILESAHAQDQQDADPDDPGAGDDDGGFGDRSLCLETTMDGAGVLRANLTPEAAAAIRAVLECLGKRNGKQDTRTQAQRDHDALHDAAGRLLGSRLLPDRAGSDTRAEVRIAFADLAGLPGGQTLTEAWLTGRTAEPGWLTGKDAEVAACDALISPVVTATPDWDVAAEMIALVADALGAHQAAAPEPGAGSDADRPPVPLPAEAWETLLYAVGKLAVKFVSGPGSIASLLRTGLLPAPFTGKSVPLDIGLSSHIPDSIRRGVIARAGGHCEWPGGCDVPAAGCDVHHVKHRKDGGPTSVASCALLCGFHHDICVHRWNWGIDLQADGTVTATSPDGSQVLRGHPNRAPIPPPAGRPPPARAA
ncbi:MAG: HNH endonuclease [Streptosporangiales bacterium]|nr:HNH endonuclease [Streptosporangiales bacterium]